MLLTQNRRPSTTASLDRLFHDFFGAGTACSSGPAADLWEDEDAATLQLEVAGWTMSQLEVTVQQDVVRVLGRREKEATPKRRWLGRERKPAGFERAFRLPFEVDTAHVEATLKDGVLEVRLPKSEDTLPRRIEVKDQPSPS